MVTLNKKFFNSAWNSIGKSVNTKYEHSVDKQEWKAMLNFVSDVKH